MKSPHAAELAAPMEALQCDTRPPTSLAVATDGAEESDAAIELARALAWRHWGTLRVISACEPVLTVPELPSTPPFGDRAALARAVVDRKVAVQSQLQRTQGPPVTAPITVRTGLVEHEVADFARSTHSNLIVAGRGRHGLLDRLLGEEHLARLLRVVKCPVLAVEPTLRSFPRRVVVRIDFGPNALAAVHAALTIAADDAAVYLVHVKPDPPFRVPHPGQWLRSYDDGVRRALEQYRAALGLAADRVVEPIVLSGSPGVALAEFARTANADLIAVGVRGAGLFSRFVMGSVTTHLLRAASCSLLTVPASPAPRAATPRSNCGANAAEAGM